MTTKTIPAVGTKYDFDGEVATVTDVRELKDNGLVLIYGAGKGTGDGEGSLLLDVVEV